MAVVSLLLFLCAVQNAFADSITVGSIRVTALSPVIFYKMCIFLDLVYGDETTRSLCLVSLFCSFPLFSRVWIFYEFKFMAERIYFLSDQKKMSLCFFVLDACSR